MDIQNLLDSLEAAISMTETELADPVGNAEEYLRTLRMFSEILEEMPEILTKI